MKHEFTAAVVTAGLALAQLSTPGSYNLGVPAVPGTRVPESNPATAVPAPQSAAPGLSTAPAPTFSPTFAPSSSGGPAYSFGAAPPPMVAPGR
jgi:hypothetical protein